MIFELVDIIADCLAIIPYTYFVMFFRWNFKTGNYGHKNVVKCFSNVSQMFLQFSLSQLLKRFQGHIRVIFACKFTFFETRGFTLLQQVRYVTYFKIIEIGLFCRYRFWSL